MARLLDHDRNKSLKTKQMYFVIFTKCTARPNFNQHNNFVIYMCYNVNCETKLCFLTWVDTAVQSSGITIPDCGFVLLIPLSRSQIKGGGGGGQEIQYWIMDFFILQITEYKIQISQRTRISSPSFSPFYSMFLLDRCSISDWSAGGLIDLILKLGRFHLLTGTDSQSLYFSSLIQLFTLISSCDLGGGSSCGWHN